MYGIWYNNIIYGENLCDKTSDEAITNLKKNSIKMKN